MKLHIDKFIIIQSIALASVANMKLQDGLPSYKSKHDINEVIVSLMFISNCLNKRENS